MRKNLLLYFLFIFLALQAQPAGYYNAAVGKYGASLKTALSGIVETHTQRLYSDLWGDFQTTDKRADGKVWDIYSSSTNYTFVTNQCGNYSGEGSCYNREHSFPKSWFGVSSGNENTVPMGTDLFHLYPSDGYVNGRRSNYPFGEVGTATYSSANGYSKLGSAASGLGYSGTVFEPADELKGDLARTYFYMVTAYDDKVASWSSDQLDGTQYPALSKWSITMFLKWSEEDPVSDKERNRNEAVYGIQHNRNPFIDHPELAEYIWGDMKGTPWSLTSGINELSIKFSTYPNPVKDILHVETDEPNLTYRILNLNGQTVIAGNLTDQQISTANLSNDMYILQLSDGNKSVVEKIIVNK